jgi:hypothetical protein
VTEYGRRGSTCEALVEVVPGVHHRCPDRLHTDVYVTVSGRHVTLCDWCAAHLSERPSKVGQPLEDDGQFAIL